MKIYDNFSPKFTSIQENKAETLPLSNKADAPINTSTSGSTNEKSFLDKFETGIRNSADLNDTVQVPRTIFKGYLAFMVGTALTTIAAMTKNNYKKTTNTLNAISIALVTYGTYSFARPYIIKTQKKNQP